jgi:hypothetical protein
VPHSTVNLALDRATRRVPGLRRLPMLKLLALAEVLLIAQQHLEQLTPAERRRVVQLVRRGHGRTSVCLHIHASVRVPRSLKRRRWRCEFG